MNRLKFIRRYLVVISAGNLLWELLQLPFYTLWQEGSWLQIVYSALHCIGGDILIALTSLALALVLIDSAKWPEEQFGKVTSLAVLFGVAYTIYSEWLNVNLYQNWAYTDAMPVLVFGSAEIGLLPLLQWTIIPPVGLWLTRILNHAQCRNS